MGSPWGHARVDFLPGARGGHFAAVLGEVTVDQGGNPAIVLDDEDVRRIHFVQHRYRRESCSEAKKKGKSSGSNGYDRPRRPQNRVQGISCVEECALHSLHPTRNRVDATRVICSLRRRGSFAAERRKRARIRRVSRRASAQ